jgi:hypothetical protein
MSRVVLVFSLLACGCIPPGQRIIVAPCCCPLPEARIEGAVAKENKVLKKEAVRQLQKEVSKAKEQVDQIKDAAEKSAGKETQDD